MEKQFGARVEKKPAGKLIGYARVSTEDQELRLQIDALEKAGCWNIYQEKRSASKGKKRPQLELALLDLRPGDTLIVWKIDRLARNVRELYRLLDEINEKGASFKSLIENYDFTTAIGQYVLGSLALAAQLEAALTSQRTGAGIKALQDRGGSYGAQPVLSKAQVKQIKKLRRIRLTSNRKGRRAHRKWTFEKLAERYGVSSATINNYLKGRSRPTK